MKLAFTRFPFESEFGGIERVTIDLLDGLVKKEIDVSFWTNCKVFLDDKYKVPGIEYRVASFPRPPVSKWGILKWIFFWPIYWFKAKKLAGDMKKKGVTHIIMFSFGEKLILTPFLHKAGIKVFWAEHERIRRWLTWNPFFLRYKRLSKQVKVIAVSEVFKDDLKQIGIDSVVVNNGVDTDFWKKNTDIQIKKNDTDIQMEINNTNLQMNANNTNKLRMITVARLRLEKGVMELFKSVEELRVTSYELIVIGDGPERERLEKFAKENDFNVKFLGSLEASEVRDEYEKADLAVFSSIERETSGLTVLEAMSMEVPVVVSNWFGSIQNINIKGVWKYEEDLNGVLEKAISEIQNLKEEDRKSLRFWVEENYSVDKMLKGYLKLLREYK